LLPKDFRSQIPIGYGFPLVTNSHWQRLPIGLLFDLNNFLWCQYFFTSNHNNNQQEVHQQQQPTTTFDIMEGQIPDQPDFETVILEDSDESEYPTTQLLSFFFHLVLMLSHVFDHHYQVTFWTTVIPIPRCKTTLLDLLLMTSLA
jgi:hypothetical protein